MGGGVDRRGVLRQDSVPDGPAHVSRSLWVQGKGGGGGGGISNAV